MNGLATKPSSCGWKVTVYVSVARESCTFLFAYRLLADHRDQRLSQWTRAWVTTWLARKIHAPHQILKAFVIAEVFEPWIDVQQWQPLAMLAIRGLQPRE